MKKIKLILASALFTTLFSCINNDNYADPDLSGECRDLTVTKSVQDVATLATSSLQSYNTASGNTPDVIEAYVTSSDEGGNFYKSISFVSVDGIKGFSVPVDDYNLYTKYPVGTKVFVNLKDRYFYNNTQTASLEIGNFYDNDTPAITTDDKVGRISGVLYQNALVRGCTKVDESTIVNHMTIAAAKNNANINKLIEFDAVQFADESLGKTYFDKSLNASPFWTATNHIIKDVSGASIIVRVSEFATFATKSVPSGNGKIRGVLTKYNSDYQFMIRTENDVMLGDPRVVPLFEETFATNFGNWSKQSVVGAQVWGTAAFGNPAPCALMNGFSSGNQNNEDWLISPAINLTSVSSALFSFETSTRYAGPALSVWVSTNYDGTSAPNTATWTQMNAANFPVWTSGSFTPWTASGAVDVSSFVGSSNFRIAFKYNSTTAGAASWEVDNVKVVGQ